MRYVTKLAGWGLMVVAGASLAAAPKVSRLAANALPPDLAVTGKVLEARQWYDSQGDNLLVLSHSGEVPSKGGDEDARDAHVYAQLFVKQGSTWQSQWKMQDMVRNCPFDLMVGFVKNSLTIGDLDHNGLAEVSFAYLVSCRSDVSPDRMKLMLYEGKTKYAIRGNTQVDPGGGAMGGDYQLDPAFTQAPRVLRDFAERQWKRLMKSSGDHLLR